MARAGNDNGGGSATAAAVAAPVEATEAAFAGVHEHLATRVPQHVGVPDRRHDVVERSLLPCHEPGGAGGAYLGSDDNYDTMWSKWQQQVFVETAYAPVAVDKQPADADR